MATSINPNQPIPNGPFYYPQTWYIQGALGPLITGSGLCIDQYTGIICAIGGGGGGGNVTSITAGAGLTGGTITSSGTIALQTTGVTAGLYPRASVTVDQYGRITDISSNPTPGTVCSITTGTGLTGGTITTTGSIAIAPTGVISGTYSYATFTVNPEGQIVSATSCTAISCLSAGAGICVVGGGGPITSTGTLALTNTGAIPGNYTLANLTVDAQGRISNVNSGTAVTCVASGTGLTGGPITGTGTLCLSDTGVTSGCYRAANICVDPQGRITFAECGCVVTCITTGVGLTGGPITSTGTVALDPVAPSPAGTFGLANVTVDAYGRVTNASSTNLAIAITGNAPITVSGTPSSVAISVQDGTTSQKGVVSLIDNVATNCNAAALTAAQGYALQQQINALTAATNLTLAGTFSAAASQMLTVTSDGLSAGFAVGSNLPAPAAGNANYFVIVTTPGSYSPPGGGTYTTTQGDWLLSDGSSWQFLNVGDDKPYATIISPGVIELATEAEVKTGSDSTLAVTPLTLFCNYVAKSSYANKGDILVASAAETYSALTVSSTNGSPLIACTTSPLGVAYGPVPVNRDLLLAKGDIIIASGASQPARLAVGLDGYVLAACSTETLGVKWIPGSTNFIPCAQITGVGSLITGTAPGVPATLGSSNNNGDVLVVCTACSNGLAWCTLPQSIPTACITNKGVILTGTSANNPTAFGPGTDGHVLAACALCPSGLYWTPFPAAIPCSVITGKGQIVAGGSANTPLALPVGTDGQVLAACAACTTGLTWVPAPAVAATPTVAGVVLGCTNATNAALGCNALLNNTGVNNVAVGLNAGRANTTGCSSVYIGQDAGCAATGSFNTVVGAIAFCDAAAGGAQSVTAIGAGALRGATGGGGCASVAVGVNAGQRVTTGTFNTLIGTAAGSFLTTGNSNVAIGPFVQFASPTASCQLVIGYGTGAYWLTGDCNKHIQPGAGIRDCAGNLGTNGQVLTSTGTAIRWSPPGSSPGFTSAGTVQDVGLGATGSSSPWPGNTTNNNVSYRQIGLKEWEVVATIYQDGFFPGAFNGDGNYLFTLPAGLRFDLSQPFQWAYTGGFFNGWLMGYGLPNASVTGGYESDGFFGSTAIIPYNNSQYRIVVSTSSSANFWSSFFYGFATSPPLLAKWSFTFFSP